MTKTKLVFVAMALALVAWVGASAATAQGGPTLTADPAYVDAAGEHEISLSGSGFTAASLNATACNTADPDEITSDNFLAICGLGSTATNDGDGNFSATVTANVLEDGVVLVMFELRPGGESARVVVTVGASDMADDMGDDDMGDDDMGDDDMADDMGDDDMGDDMGDDMADDMADDMGDDDMADDMDDDMDDDMADDMGDDDMADDMGDDDMADDMADDMGDDDMADDMDDDMADDMGDDMLADTGSNTPLLAIVALAVVLAGAMVLGLSRRLRTQQ
ncbi:MAG: hypothetical protein OXG30_08370 [bacterium]|nr:hypothetical protein [bacterium]